MATGMPSLSRSKMLRRSTNPKRYTSKCFGAVVADRKPWGEKDISTNKNLDQCENKRCFWQLHEDGFIEMSVDQFINDVMLYVYMDCMIKGDGIDMIYGDKFGFYVDVINVC